MCILGAHTALRSAVVRLDLDTTRRERYHGALWSCGSLCVVSALLFPNSPPGTTTELPCCQLSEFFFKFFLSRSSARSRFLRPSRLATSRRAGRYFFQDRFECTPDLCTHETPVSISDIHRDTVLCDQENHRDLPLLHIELPSALFFL